MFSVFVLICLTSSELIVEIGSKKFTGSTLAECVENSNLKASEITNVSIISGSLMQSDMIDFGVAYPSCIWFSIEEQVEVENNRLPDRMFFCHKIIAFLNILTVNISIGESTFQGCLTLHQLYIPHLVEIGASAFADCEFQSIDKSFEFPECCKIGESAFENSWHFQKVTFPKLKILPLNAFKNSSIESLVIPSVEKLCGHSLDNCSAIKNVCFESVIEFALTTFLRTSLTTLKLPSLKRLPTGIGNEDYFKSVELFDLPNLLEVDKNTFELSRNLKEVYFDSVKKVGVKAFSFCTSLHTVHLENVQYIYMNAFEYCISLKNLFIPNVQYIGIRSFFVCISLTEIKCLSLTNISRYAFEKCRFLKTFDAPNLIGAEEGILADCQQVKSLVFLKLVECNSKMLAETSPKSIEFMEVIEIPVSFCAYLPITKATFHKAKIVHEEAFTYCSELTEINLPNVEYIDSCSFQCCANLCNVNFPSLVKIADFTFVDCSKLTYFKAENLTTIGESNFNSPNIELCLPSLEKTGGYFLQDLISPLSALKIDKLRIIGNYGFTNSSFDNLTFENLEYAGDEFLESSINLKEVSIPSLLMIGKNAFINCVNLKTINLPKLISVNCSDFINCQNLININLSECFSIMENSFVDCHSLVSVEFPYLHDIFSNSFIRCYSLQRISAVKLKSLYSQTFEECNNITFFDFPSLIMVGDSSLFKHKLYQKEQKIPSLIVIESSFAGNRYIENVTIENAMYILNSSFEACESIKEIRAEKAKYIGRSAFSGCKMLVNLYLPKVLYLSENSFMDCSSIQKIDFRKVNDIIGDSVFENCYSLQTIILSSLKKVNETYQNIFKNCSNLTRIDFDSVEPSTFNKYAFESTGIQKVRIHGVTGIPINLCLPYKKDYENYSTEGRLWKGIFNDQPDNFFQICTLSKEQIPSHLKVVFKNVIIPILSVILISVIAFVIYKIFAKHKQNVEDAKSLYISVIDDDEDDIDP